LYVAERVQVLLVLLVPEAEEGLLEPLQHGALAHVARTVQVTSAWAVVDRVDSVELVQVALEAWGSPVLALAGAGSDRVVAAVVAVVSVVVVVDREIALVLQLFAQAV
jgi:hypothetical protein